MKVSLAGAEQKITQINNVAAQHAKVHPGMPDFSHVVGRNIASTEEKRQP